MQVTALNWQHLVVATALGAFLGILMAFCINSVLIQISINAFFNIYFGVLFMSTGIMLLYRNGTKARVGIAGAELKDLNSSGLNFLGTPAHNAPRRMDVQCSQDVELSTLNDSASEAASLALTAENNTRMLQLNHVLQVLFSSMVLMSGILCVFLE